MKWPLYLDIDLFQNVTRILEMNAHPEEFGGPSYVLITVKLVWKSCISSWFVTFRAKNRARPMNFVWAIDKDYDDVHQAQSHRTIVPFSSVGFTLMSNARSGRVGIIICGSHDIDWISFM